MSAPPFVSITTDYGLSDGFVAAVHGAVLRICPYARIIDVTHDVHPGDVARGATVLAQTVPHLPTGVHVGVVDPGVGTDRQAIALRTPDGFLVGPDNGLLIAAAEALGGVESAVSLTNAEWHASTVTSTFHGRDIFAPVAARLASGADLTDAGSAIDPASLVRLPPPFVHIAAGAAEVEVLSIDRFGNVQLAMPASALDELARTVTLQGQRAKQASTFADVAPGDLILFADSAGQAAIAINGGRAVVALGVAPGDVIRIADA
jgi:S-adenosyl-L-methionine hydrolase (adenosine-forming)